MSSVDAKLTLLGTAALSSSLLAIGSPALASNCTAVPGQEIVGNGTFCVADLSNSHYQSLCTGHEQLCHASIAQAMQDANAYFLAEQNSRAVLGLSFLVQIAGGGFDLSSVIGVGASANPLFLLPVANPPAAERLIIAGCGWNGTTNNGTSTFFTCSLSGSTTTNAGIYTTITKDFSEALISNVASQGATASPFSHLTVQGIKVQNDYYPTSQGTVAGASTSSELPDPLYNSNGETTTSNAVTIVVPSYSGTATLGFSLPGAYIPAPMPGQKIASNLMRIYDNNLPLSVNGTQTIRPQIDMTSVYQESGDNPPSEVYGNDPLRYHAACNINTVYPTAQVPHYNCPISGNNPNAWVVFLGDLPGPLQGQTDHAAQEKALTWWSNCVAPNGSSSCQGTTTAPNYIACLTDHTAVAGQFIHIDDRPMSQAGTDIVVDTIRLRGVAESYLLNTNNNVLSNIDISVEPQTIQQGQWPCLSTSIGGFQIVGTGTNSTYGNHIIHYAASYTADDSIAIFNDISQTPIAGNNSLFSTSSIVSSSFHDNLGHAIHILNPAKFDDTDLTTIEIPPYAGTSASGTINSGGCCDSSGHSFGLSLCGGAAKPTLTPFCNFPGTYPVNTDSNSTTSCTITSQSFRASIPDYSGNAPLASGAFTPYCFMTLPSNGNTITSISDYCPSDNAGAPNSTTGYNPQSFCPVAIEYSTAN